MGSSNSTEMLTHKLAKASTHHVTSSFCIQDEKLFMLHVAIAVWISRYSQAGLRPSMITLLLTAVMLAPKVARLACGAVANAAEDSSTHKPLLSRTNAMHYMVFLMRSRHLSIHREASRACGNLLTSRDAHKDFMLEVRSIKFLRIDEEKGQLLVETPTRRGGEVRGVGETSAPFL